MDVETIALIKALGGFGGGGGGAKMVHFTWNDDYTEILSAA